MNNFEGINTGKWFINEKRDGCEAECPVCGYCLPVTVNLDLYSFKPQVRGLEDFCPSCGEAMFKDEATYVEECRSFIDEASSVVCSTEPSAKSLVINCETIIL